MASASVKTLPEGGKWTIDSIHSFVAFSVEHFTVALARGIAAGPTGSITIAPEIGDSLVEASIDVSTITTGNAARDEKILGPEVLDSANFKTIDFSSDSLRSLGTDRYVLDGHLTLHGTTRPVMLEMVFNGVIEDTFGKTRLGLTASTDIDRDEFGSGEWAHRPLTAGGFMVPHAVRVTLDIEATKDELAD